MQVNPIFDGRADMHRKLSCEAVLMGVQPWLMLCQTIIVGLAV
jgi:hypothetical protein